MGQNERRRLVEHDRALEGEQHVFRADRIAGVELHTVTKREGYRSRRGIGRPFGGQTRHEFFRIFSVVLDEPVIDVGNELAGGEFKRLCRIDRDDVIDVLGHHKHVGRRCGEGTERRHRQSQHGCEGSRLEYPHSSFSSSLAVLFVCLRLRTLSGRNDAALCRPADCLR